MLENPAPLGHGVGMRDGCPVYRLFNDRFAR